VSDDAQAARRRQFWQAVDRGNLRTANAILGHLFFHAGQYRQPAQASRRGWRTKEDILARATIQELVRELNRRKRGARRVA